MTEVCTNGNNDERNSFSVRCRIVNFCKSKKKKKIEDQGPEPRNLVLAALIYIIRICENQDIPRNGSFHERKI